MNRTMTRRQAEPWMAILKGVLLAVAATAVLVAVFALVGFLYMAAGVLVYALLTGQRLTAFSYLADLLLGLAAGGLTGMVRSRVE